MSQPAAAAEGAEVFLTPTHLSQYRRHLVCAILTTYPSGLVPVGVKVFVKHAPVVCVGVCVCVMCEGGGGGGGGGEDCLPGILREPSITYLETIEHGIHLLVQHIARGGVGMGIERVFSTTATRVVLIRPLRCTPPAAQPTRLLERHLLLLGTLQFPQPSLQPGQLYSEV